MAVNNFDVSYQDDEKYDSKEDLSVERHYMIKEIMEDISHSMYLQNLRQTLKKQSELILQGFYGGDPRIYKEPKTIVDFYKRNKATEDMKNIFIFRRCKVQKKEDNANKEK